jgi:hypothetical protein
MDLTPPERALLDFERSWWLGPAGKTKAQAIRDRLGISPSAYRGRLARLVDSEAALAYDPLLVGRLRRRRLARLRRRFEGEAVRGSRPR